MAARDPWFDVGTEPMRRRHLDPLVDWIRAAWGDGGRTRLLDYGCGDLLLASMLGPGFVVHGYDPDPVALRAASRRVARGEGAALYQRPDQIPVHAFDGVILSSVVQYLHGTEELAEMLRRLAAALAPGAVGVVVTDLPAPGGRRIVDAWDSWRDLTAAFGPLRATRGLLRGARRSPGHLWTPEPSEIDAACRTAGFVPEWLPQNLSNFSQRSSLLLQHRPHGPRVAL